MTTVAVSICILTVAACLERRGEQITCNEPIWEMGETATKTVFHEFRVYNYSNKAVEVLGVDVSCGCLVVEDLEKVVASGESLPIPVRFDVPNLPGKFKKQLLVQVKDLERPIVLTIQGNVPVAGKVFFAPARIDFGTAANSGPVIRSVIVGRYDNKDVGDIEVERGAPGLVLVRAEAIDFGRRKLVFSLDGRVANDEVGSVAVRSTSDEFESLTIPIVSHSR